MYKSIAITLTVLVAVSSGRPTVPSQTVPKTLPLVVPVEGKGPVASNVGPVEQPSISDILPINRPINPPAPGPKTFPLVEPVGPIIPKTLPLIEPVDTKTVVPQTFPSFEQVNSQVKTLPLVVPVNPKSRTFPLVKPVGPIVPKTLPLVEPVNPTQQVPKTFPLVEPVDTIIPKTLPLIEPVDTKTVVPQTFPSFEQVNSQVKTLPLVVPVNPKSRTFPLVEPVGPIVPKTLPLVEPVDTKKTIPQTFPSYEPVNPQVKTLPLVVPVEGPVASNVGPVEQQSISDILPINKPINLLEQVPKTFPLVEPVGPIVPKTLPLVEPVETKTAVPHTFPSYEEVNSQVKTLPLVVPVNPKSRTFPLVEPVGPIVPKTLPLVEPVNPTQQVPKTFPLVEPIETKPQTLPLVVPVESESFAVPKLAVSEANNQLGLSLLKNLNEEKKNLFFSPLSLSTALAMLYSGAKGTTAQQMREVLAYNKANLIDQQVFEQYHDVLEHLKSVQARSNDNTIHMANKMVVQKNFDVLKSFEDNLKQNFESTVDVVDFANSKTTDEINEWVRKETNDKIKKLLDGPLDESTKMVLLNAIYFKGVFQTKFDEKLTKEDTFFADDNQQKTTKMMRRKGKFNYTSIPELDSDMIEIPYTGYDTSLFVVLPKQRQGLKTLNKAIEDWSQIEKAISNLRERTVDAYLPKFKIETSYTLKDKLSKMGMSSAFTPSADLSGIDGRQDLEVSEVVHKAFVEVNEEGTEAAAATGIINRTTAVVGPPMIPVFRADHPFMFFVRDNVNRMNLFVGQVNQL